MDDGSLDATWRKYDGNPVLGGDLGTCFDLCVLPENSGYRMWFSWRPKQSIAHSTSIDGYHWSQPDTVLGPDESTGWESDINRPSVVQCRDGYHMWYTGQAGGGSKIGYAFSRDGISWDRRAAPVLEPNQAWEKVAVMCPDCHWDQALGRFRMWYSGGEQYEPDAIGYAESADGIVWTKPFAGPVFSADSRSPWEQHKVTACQIVFSEGWHYMFYVGFRDIHHAGIGLARSRDGVTDWQRFPHNPIVESTPGEWDGDAVYKPFALFDGSQWLLWYNGRRGNKEQIGAVVRSGASLDF